MHLAICAENVADRKQLERLLRRESDKNVLQNGTLYIDSFGSAVNMLKNPMQYDAFFLDCSEHEVLPLDIIKKLWAAGSRAAMILCVYDSDLQLQLSEEISPILFLEKPIKPEILSRTIEQVRSIKDSAEPLIEFRAESQTLYVTEPEILYAVAAKDSIEIHLTNNRILNIQNSIANLFSEVSAYETFFVPNAKTLLNGRHIQKLKGLKAYMPDGTAFSIGLTGLSYARYIFQKFHK